MHRQLFSCLAAIALAALLTGPAGAQATPYSQDFEGLDLGDPDALVNDGWFAFVNAFDPYPTGYLYGYGLPAYNGGPRVSALVSGQGGPDQGEIQLSVYSDYLQSDHGNGITIETNLYRQYQIGPENVGQTWIFKFDAKRGNINDCGGFPCQSTALGFIKIFTPDFSGLPVFLAADTTDLPDTWGTFQLAVYIDPGLVGFWLQFGFLNTATFYEPSGVYYDNVVFEAFEPDPATQGYWYRQCLGVPEADGGIAPSRFGRGPSAPTEPGFVDELMPCAEASLGEFYVAHTCDGMNADPASDVCERALKQITALILNVCSGRLLDSTPVDVAAEGCEATNVGGLISELRDLYRDGWCGQASECAAAVNEGFGVSGGASPSTAVAEPEPEPELFQRGTRKPRSSRGRR